MTTQAIGISAMAAYLPPYRVNLQSWCDWTGENWDKIRTVIGHSFRMRGPGENVYTMSATAIMRLIRQYDLDPSRIGFLALGTESSTDNSAGAVIVKGMVNEGLAAEGRPLLPRNCEVPEFKHACLGGIYAIKNALRYLAFDGRGKQALVVSGDIAEYARSTSGEPTQGAGAVAMLLEAEPKLLAIDLNRSGSASDYRGPDFRKPFARFGNQNAAIGTPLKDFPVFNGKYSTTCYVDAVLMAMEDMFQRRGGDRRAYLDSLGAVFMHRPYQRMPETGYGMAYLYALATGNAVDRAVLAEHCSAAGIDPAAVIAELGGRPSVFSLVSEARVDDDVYPLAMQVLRSFRKSPLHAEAIASRLELGATAMREVGNLYSAALPAWLAAGLEEAARSDRELGGSELLTIGYGSGDAAEAVPMRVRPQWREAASRIRFDESFTGARDLGQEDYECLHESGHLHTAAAGSEFIIDRVGCGTRSDFDDLGIEYYRHVPNPRAAG
ncbi:MAG: hydroxymethylglutaryl-CoA synthase family protein [Gammaproteobacteria bacterium]|nr:hydroxymethylglutaryl-CoA synthase family protein [Gammaproteobacteria bacterium]